MRILKEEVDMVATAFFGWRAIKITNYLARLYEVNNAKEAHCIERVDFLFNFLSVLRVLVSPQGVADNLAQLSKLDDVVLAVQGANESVEIRVVGSKLIDEMLGNCLR